MLRHWVTWSVARQALMSWSDMDSHVMENVTLTRISSKLPLAKSWPRPSKDSGRRSPKISDVTECQTTSGHDPTCGEVCLRYCVRVTLTSSVCAFLSNMRRNWHAGRATLAVFLHRVGRQTSQLLARSEVVSGRASPFFSVPVNATCECAFLRCSRSRVRSCHHPMIQHAALHISLSVVALPTLS